MNHVQAINQQRIQQHRDRQRSIRQNTTRPVSCPITLYWNSICQYCSYIHLNTSSAADKKKCCLNGLAMEGYPENFKLKPIEEPLLSIYKTNEFQQQCTTSNNILCFAATGVENDHGGGWIGDIMGPHAIKLNGRTYHCMFPATNSTDASGGLSYFLFDNHAALSVAAQNRNLNMDNITEMLFLTT